MTNSLAMFAPADFGGARNTALRNELAGLQVAQAREQMTPEARKNRMTAQQMDQALRGYKFLSEGAKTVRDQGSLDAFRAKAEQVGVAGPGELPAVWNEQTAQSMQKLAYGAQQKAAEYGAPVAGVDPTGKPEYRRFSPTDIEGKVVPGFTPPPKTSADTQRKVKSSEFVPGGGVRTLYDDGTVEFVRPTEEEQALIRAGEERGVDLQGSRAQARGIGTGTAKIANTALDRTEKLRSNNSTLRQVIAEVKGGADTGPLANKLPSFRASSLRLQQLKNELGLDVVGSVTFGALSEGELAMAMDTALPTGLQGPELVQWAQNKIDAQEKLAQYLEEQAVFLSKPGNTAADWMMKVRENGAARGSGQAGGQPPAEQAQPASTQAPASIGRFQVEVVR
jgi:hypothetical protein